MLKNESLKVNIMKGFEAKEKNKKIYANIKEYEAQCKNITANYGIFNRTEEQKEEYKKIDAKIIQERIKKEACQNEINIFANNISYLILEVFKNEIIPELKRFESKNIGPKTKEKITELVQNYFKNNYDANLQVYFNLSEYFSEAEFNFKIYSNDKDLKEHNYYTLVDEWSKIYINSYNHEINESIKKDNKYICINGTGSNIKYIPVQEVKAKAKKIYNDKIKVTSKIEKLKKEISTLRNNFNEESAKSFLYDDNYIKDIKIY